MSEKRVVRAAGAVLWRRQHGVLHVALVHRPRYDDWSWPKGKLDKHETAPSAAVREVLEETGLEATLGVPLPRARYPLSSGEAKDVRYWAARVDGGSGALDHEVDRVEWVPLDQAEQWLTHRRDARQAHRVALAAREGWLQTWPLIVVRHAESVPRSKWKQPDVLRPLDAEGRRRAVQLAPLLDAFGPDRVITSPATRCLETIEPFVAVRGVPVRTKRGLSEEGHERKPGKAGAITRSALERGAPVILDTHRPVLPDVLCVLAEHSAQGGKQRRKLEKLAGKGLEKGEAVVAHVVGQGSRARVVAVERHRP